VQGDGVDAMTELEDAMALIQEPLGAEFTAIWDANVDKLYES